MDDILGQNKAIQQIWHNTIFIIIFKGLAQCQTAAYIELGQHSFSNLVAHIIICTSLETGEERRRNGEEKKTSFIALEFRRGLIY